MKVRLHLQPDIARLLLQISQGANDRGTPFWKKAETLNKDGYTIRETLRISDAGQDLDDVRAARLLLAACEKALTHKLTYTKRKGMQQRVARLREALNGVSIVTHLATLDE